MKKTGFDVFVDEAARLESWVQTDPGLRPEQPGLEILVDLGSDARVLNRDERGDVSLIVVVFG